VRNASPPANPIFTDEPTARAALEALRWPDGPVCPKSSCGAKGPAIAKIGGVKQSHRSGLYRCKTCRAQFTVTVGTIFERSKVPLNDWLWVGHILSSNKKLLVTALDVQTELAVTYKTALKILKRIAAALRGYKGFNVGFGHTVRVFLTNTRPPKPENLGIWRDKYKARRGGGDGVPKVTGLLASFALEVAPAEDDLERTERLLRLLLAAVPKPSKSAKRKAAKLRRLERSAVLAATPQS
jgi:transposase-like protein